MVSFSHRIEDVQGLHAQPIARIVSAARQHRSTATLSCQGRSASARDLMGLMELDVRQGDVLDVSIEGPDEAETRAALSAIISTL